MGKTMHKYVVFIKSDESKVIPKESVTHSLIKDMKKKKVSGNTMLK